MQLVCTECGRDERPGDHGWLAVPFVDDETGETTLLAYCPDCGRREFGAPPPPDEG